MVCDAGFWRMRLAANGVCAAIVRMADQRAMEAWAAAFRKAGTTERLRACARRRRKSAASLLHLPPASIARTTRRQRAPPTSSGYVRSLACRAARNAGDPGWRPWGRGSPELVKGETIVVSTASCAPLCRGSPCAITSIRRLSSRFVLETFRSDTKTFVATRAPASVCSGPGALHSLLSARYGCRVQASWSCGMARRPSRTPQHPQPARKKRRREGEEGEEEEEEVAPLLKSRNLHLAGGEKELKKKNPNILFCRVWGCKTLT